MRNNNGISLLSLIITIFLLITLSSVCTLLYKGLLKTANELGNAVDEINSSTAQEQAEMLVTEALLDYYADFYQTDKESNSKEEFLTAELDGQTNVTKEYILSVNNGNIQVYKGDLITGAPVTKGTISSDGIVSWED